MAPHRDDADIRVDVQDEVVSGLGQVDDEFLAPRAAISPTMSGSPTRRKTASACPSTISSVRI